MLALLQTNLVSRMGVLNKQGRKRSNLLYTNFLSADDIDT